jgi:hypothetical protein
MLYKAPDLDESLNKQPMLRNMDMRFGMLNARSFYGVVSDELSKYTLHLVGV